MTESKPRHTLGPTEQAVAAAGFLWDRLFDGPVEVAEIIDKATGLSDLLAENERLRSQLAELRKALGIIETWGGDYITGQSVYEFASAALARSKKGEG